MHEIRKIPGIGEDDVPFEEANETDDQHREKEEMAFFHPGHVLVLDPDILGDQNIRKVTGKNRQDGHERDDFLLHGFFEGYDVVDEKPLEKMPRQDQVLFQGVIHR